MTQSQRISQKAASFTESVIREMTRLAVQHDAINLAQGFPNFSAPQAIKDAACEAIRQDINQYSITWGPPIFVERLPTSTKISTTGILTRRRRSRSPVARPSA